MARSMRLYTGRKGVQLLHIVMVAVGIKLNDFHRFQPVELRFLLDFVFAVVTVVGKMADIGDVTHITHFVAQIFQIPEQQVESNGRTGMSQMGIPVDGGPANVQPDKRRIDRFELFFLAR